MLTPGQDHDLACAGPLLENTHPGAVIADKAYDADALIDKLTGRERFPSSDPRPIASISANVILCSIASEISSSVS
jgi:IS5 family transposase